MRFVLGCRLHLCACAIERFIENLRLESVENLRLESVGGQVGQEQ